LVFSDPDILAVFDFVAEAGALDWVRAVIAGAFF